jgi:hypothetical protein
MNLVTLLVRHGSPRAIVAIAANERKKNGLVPSAHIESRDFFERAVEIIVNAWSISSTRQTAALLLIVEPDPTDGRTETAGDCRENECRLRRPAGLTVLPGRLSGVNARIAAEIQNCTRLLAEQRKKVERVLQESNGRR